MKYEAILQRMLEKVPGDVDKREGSIIYDALAPAAAELAIMYIELDVIENESFADTASRQYLIRRCRERGIAPKAASNAYFKAVYTPKDTNLKIGDRFSINELDYIITSPPQNGECTVMCETEGKIGNKYTGELTPIDNIPKLESIRLVELTIPGEDVESTESLREHYFETFNVKSFGGNITDYIQKTMEVSGVGAVKVTPVYNGPGTVLITILDSEFNPATSELINKVQQIIDPTQDGEGKGIAPIGHRVTVQTVSPISVSIQTNITLDSGYTEINPENVLNDYLLSLRKTWADSNNQYVRIAQIENAIMSIDGVIDIADTTMNGKAENLLLTEYEIPTLGEVVLT